METEKEKEKEKEKESKTMEVMEWNVEVRRCMGWRMTKGAFES